MIQKKVCLLGASGVGKTSLVRRYVEGIFSEKYLTSIGVKVDKKLLQVDQKQVQLMLWDIEGVDCYSGFNARYLRGASFALVVVDQTRPKSLLEGLEICQLVKASVELPIALVVNKVDLPAGPLWDAHSIDLARSAYEYTFETSAKTGTGVEAMFCAIAKKLLMSEVS